MITVTPVRSVPAWRRCPVCRGALAPRGANVAVTIDAETDASIQAVTHKACASLITQFTRERGYTPGELAEVGVWGEGMRRPVRRERPVGGRRE